MQEAYSKEQARFSLGEIGNKNDQFEAPLDTVAYLDEIDSGFRIDFGFGFRDLINVHQVLAGWTYYATDVPVSTHYEADPEQIKAACVEGIQGFDESSLGAILAFITLDPATILRVEDDPKPAADLPVWEYRKRVTRYGLKSLIKLKDRYYWGPHSADRAGRIWSLIAAVDKLPAEIPALTVSPVLQRAHDALGSSLQTSIREIVTRFTSEVEEEVQPFKLGFASSDIGDIDVFALLRPKNVILNIESKIIDQAHCHKDLKRVFEKIFGRESSGGSLVAGYLQVVEQRASFLESNGRQLAEHYWQRLPGTPTVVSIFVTQTSHWWTEYPPRETRVTFVELALLEQFLQSL